MIEFIKLDANSMVPKYMQIIDSIIYNITVGNVKIGDKIPSINKLSEEFYLSRDTVERAYSVLKKRKVVVSVHGKGTYVSQNQINSKQNVLFLVNKLSTFKMKVYDSFVKEIGDNYQVDLHSYHCDESLFLELLTKYKSTYDYYVIVPHFRSKTLLHKNSTDKVSAIINDLPKNNLVLLDNKEHNIKGDFIEVSQDYEKDIISALEAAKKKIVKYNKLTLVYPKSTFYPYPRKILTGFKKYCTQNNFKFEIIEEVSNETPVDSKSLFITIEENDLVNIVNKVRANNYILGKDVGVISYNDTPLKQLLGITVITSDFISMGSQAAKMVLKNKKEKQKTPFNFIDRESL
ncbi:GntR family transcriptional regulator [uncultured Polaribacter sp.]|uniref:GntR family transcriptional regulator n=1 Tax=uncultured Polaribacter sp. TaxID=174711 RepID=UPI0026386A2A|nr:GntR family transcriptional regulator [uncultured Polaribacter sp.]